MSDVHIRVRAGGEHYALPVDRVMEAAEIGDVTPVPGTPPEILGVRNLRGHVLPVIDLASLLGLPAERKPERILVAEEGDLLVGLAVQSIVAVDEIPAPTLAADSELLVGAALVDGDLVGVLDLPAALAAVAREGRP